MKIFFNEGSQIHNFISSSVINYGSGSGSDFLTNFGSGSGSTSQKVTVPTVPVPVPQHCFFGTSRFCREISYTVLPITRELNKICRALSFYFILLPNLFTFSLKSRFY
jgi:hypothetical protein